MFFVKGRKKNGHQNSKDYDVMISGYFGFDNIGEEAVLLSIIENLRAYKQDIKIVVLSNDINKTKVSYNVDAVDRNKYFEIIKTMFRTKMYISAGGHFIKDNVLVSMLYYLSAIWIAKKIGLKVVLYSNGAGPLTEKISTKLTEKVLNNVDIITIREEMSWNLLRQLKITKPQILLTADSALTLKCFNETDVDDFLRNQGVDLSLPILGFSITGCRDWSNKFIEYIFLIANFMRDKYQMNIIFLPTESGGAAFCEKILNRMDGEGYIIKGNTISQTIGIIKKVDMLISNRYHPLVFSAGVGTPAIGIAWERRIESVVDYYNLVSAGYIKNLEFKDFRCIVERTWENRMNIRTQRMDNISNIKEKSYQNAKVTIDILKSI